MGLPETKAECGGCDKPLSLLSDHLQVVLKPLRGILVSTEIPSENADEVPGVSYAIGVKSGRGVILRFHNFECGETWFAHRAGLQPKLEYHHEEGEPYEPEDNRTVEELVDAGELPEEILAFHAAMDGDDEA